MPRITIRDVAKAAGTSVSAVSAVLNANRQHNIRVSAATRERILAAASALDYTPNLVARSLVTRKTGVLGLVFPYSTAFTENNPFFTQVMSGVFEEVIRAKYNVMLHTAIGDDWDAEDENMLPDPRMDGLILVLPPPNSRIMERCRRRKVPFVSLVCNPPAPDVCAINADEFTGGRLATQHLIEMGHRRIAHFAGNFDVATAEPRQEGYLAALRDAGIEPDPKLIIPASFGWQGGYKAMQQVLKWPVAERPTAIFACNDPCADGAIRTLTEHGLRAPDDMALVGYDDTWFATMLQPPLTSVHMPIYEMSTLAVRMLIALVEGREMPEKQPILPVRLTVRDSSGAQALRKHSSSKEM